MGEGALVGVDVDAGVDVGVEEGVDVGVDEGVEVVGEVRAGLLQFPLSLLHVLVYKTVGTNAPHGVHFDLFVDASHMLFTVFEDVFLIRISSLSC